MNLVIYRPQKEIIVITIYKYKKRQHEHINGLDDLSLSSAFSLSSHFPQYLPYDVRYNILAYFPYFLEHLISRMV